MAVTRVPRQLPDTLLLGLLGVLEDRNVMLHVVLGVGALEQSCSPTLRHLTAQQSFCTVCPGWSTRGAL